jgi:hypothetical protein
MRVALLSLTMIMVTSVFVQAEVLEFPLPDITGGLATYQDSVVYIGDTLEVSAVRLVVHAVIDDLGYQICSTAPPLPAEVCTLGFHYYGTVWKNHDQELDYGPDGDYENSQTGDYERTIGWTAGPWGFTELVSGDVVHVVFELYKELLCCSTPVETYDPVVTLTNVTLLIEVSGQVHVEQKSWGSLKNLYDGE